MEYLRPEEGQYFIDCTLGGAGYAMAISERIGEGGKILAIDMDPMAILNAQKQIEKNKYKNIILEHDNFKNLSQIIKKNFPSGGPVHFHGIVFDLGLSGAQLQDEDRGFAFSKDSPLDMDFDKGSGAKTTEHLVNNSDEGDLRQLIRNYGEEKFAASIARHIIQYRKSKTITTTRQLVEIILSAIPKRFQHGNIHPATRTFQAFRIATNKELQNLEEVLPQALTVLQKGGRLAIVSFHSLEDRIVKLFFKKESTDCLCPPSFPKCICGHKASLKIITKKIITPTEEEIRMNPRSRSAKLRVAERV